MKKYNRKTNQEYSDIIDIINKNVEAITEDYIREQYKNYLRIFTGMEE